MAAPPRFCLACGIATQPSNRRLLCSEASSTVHQVWNELLAERLKERHIEADVQSVLQDGCVCKKCFMAIKAFYERKMQLLIHLDAAIEKMPSSANAVQFEARQSRKRACDSMPDETVKRQRLNSAISTSTSTSPGVQVCQNY